MSDIDKILENFEKNLREDNIIKSISFKEYLELYILVFYIFFPRIQPGY